MGFFDRFNKKKKDEKKQLIKEDVSANKEDELTRKYNEAMKSIDEREAELNRQLEHAQEFDIDVSKKIKNLNNAPGATKVNEMAMARLKKMQEEKRQEEFAKSLLGQKYADIRHYVGLKKWGLHPESEANFSPEIKKAAEIMEEYGFNLNCLLLPFLIEKEAKQLLYPNEKEELMKIIGGLSDEELCNCLSYSVSSILFSEVLGPFKTDEDQEKIKLFMSSVIKIEELKQKMEYSRK